MATFIKKLRSNSRKGSVQKKFLLWILPILSVVFILLGTLLYINERNKQTLLIEDMSSQIVKARSDEVGRWLNSLILELQQIANRNIVKTADWQTMKNELIEIGESRTETYGFLSFIEPDGTYYSTIKGKSDKNLASQDYYREVFEEGKAFSISNPYISLTNAKPIFVINVPITNDDNEIIGGIAGIVYVSTLSEIAENIKIGETGYGFIIDSKGLTVAHPDAGVRMNLNIIEDADELGYENLSTIGNQMIRKESGYGKHLRPDGVEELLIYNRIPKSPNWTLGVAVHSEEVFVGVQQLLINLATSFLATLIVLSIILWILSRNIITIPLKKLISVTREISNGYLNQNITIKSNDEVGEMAGALRRMTDELRRIVNSIQKASDNIASGSRQISSSSEQVAQGANQQASSTEQISSSMEEMVANINQNSDNARETESIATKAAQGINNVREASIESLEAVRFITEKISIIDEIAERTDLLAINAAIEAARAGEQGKGFAVVANEIRKLAERSQKAAQEIDKYSKSSLDTTEKAGTLMEGIIPEVERTAQLIQEIAAASIEQNSGATQVNDAVQQLSNVTQENSAASEQMSTGASELARQAELLRKTIAFFSLEGKTSEHAFDKILKHAEKFQDIINQMKTGEIDEEKWFEKMNQEDVEHLAKKINEVDDNKVSDKKEKKKEADKRESQKNKGVVINLDADDEQDNDFTNY